jgi:hypothetical protein
VVEPNWVGFWFLAGFGSGFWVAILEAERRIARAWVCGTFWFGRPMKNYPRRDRIVNVRMSEHDHKRLLERAQRARAKTPSAYIRAAALTGREFELP